MIYILMSTPFWLDDPTVLFKQNSISKIWPSKDMTSNEKLNAMTRLIFILTILGYLITKTLKIIITGVVTLFAIMILRYAEQFSNTSNSIKKEGFINPSLYQIDPKAFQSPEPSNPAMNVLLTQISDEPDRKQAAPAYNPEVEEKMNKATQAFISSNFDNPKIDEKLFKDLGDSFDFDNSMRTWYATANTQIPNDQKGFAEYCYGNMISCKEGNPLACTRSMPPRWTSGCC